MKLPVLVLLLIYTSATRVTRNEKKGELLLHNCGINKNVALKFPVPLNFDFTVFPYWNNYRENKDNPDLVFRYSIHYKLVTVIEKKGKEIETPIDISKLKSHSKNFFTIPPYFLSPGYYKLYPTATLQNKIDNLKPLGVKVCHMIVVDLEPLAVIIGGTYRSVPRNIPLVLNGSESIDFNLPTRTSTSLKFFWSCTQKLQPPSFCKRKPISTKNSFIIPPRFVISEDKFQFTLNVTTRFGKSAQVEQKIEIVSNGVLLYIQCRKNCPPVSDWSNLNILTFLVVKCLKNCEDINDEDYNWTIEPQSPNSNFRFNYERDTQFGNVGLKFIIKENILKPDKYIVGVNLNKNDKIGKVTKLLIYLEPPKVESCVTIPPNGLSLMTVFTLTCDQKRSFKSHFYELYAVDKNDDISNGQLVVDGFYPEIEKIEFLLPSSENHNFIVRVSIDNGPYTLIDVNPEVKTFSSNKPTTEIIEKLNQIYNGKNTEKSIGKLMSSTDSYKREEGFQNFQALVNELTDLKEIDANLTKYINDFKFQVINDFLKIPTSSLKEMMKISDVMTKLILLQEPDKSDPLLGKFTSTFCKKYIQKYVESMKREKNALYSGDISKKISKTTRKCLESNTNPNYPILEPIAFNITTQSSVLFEQALEENYPEYKDFSDETYKSIQNLQDATSNILESSTATAKAIALTVAVGEDLTRQKGKISELLMVKDEARYLAKMIIESNNITLIPSKDFDQDDHPIDIFMTTWTKDIFWWNPKNIRIVTNIITLDFWHSTCVKKIKNFIEPSHLFFNIQKQNFKTEIIEDVMRLPGDYLSLFYQDLSRHIYVRRVSLPQNTSLLVEFHNLSSIAFNVVATALKFPTIEDFTPGKVIQANKSKIIVFNNFNYDCWCYIGILPKKETVTNQQVINLKLSFSIRFCVRWNNFRSEWKPTCQGGSGNSLLTIHCKCSEFSTIAGYVQKIQSIKQEVLTEDLSLELQASYIIFTVVASTFALYCLLLLFTLSKRKKKSLLYFIADNFTKHQYGYLVIVTTGSVGTTSHVSVKISGRHSRTTPHVLNYPDPKMRLLQKKTKDIFVISNGSHLGKITGLELWVDCYGAKPSWYCKEIEIYDLQWKQSFYFQVNRLLSVEKGNIYLNLQPTELEKEKKWLRILRKISVWNGLHTWCFWAQEASFSYIQRLTVAFSNILFILVGVFLIQGIPEMKIRDSLDLKEFYFGRSEMIVGVEASLVSFSFHIALAWIFRLSSDKLEGKHLPYGGTQFCWKSLIFLVIFSTTILISWGFWLPYNHSLSWLSASGFGLALDIILYENLVNIIAGFFYKFEKIEYKGNKYDQILGIIEKQRFHLRVNFGRKLLKSHVEHLHEPPKKSKIKEQKLKHEIRKTLGGDLMDLIMFGIYFIILYVVILINRAQLTIRLKNEIENMFLGKHSRSLNFLKIDKIKGIYQYINETLIVIMQSQVWYKNYSIKDSGMMIDFSNKYIGVARFRQQRTMITKCIIPDLLNFLNFTKCWPEFQTNFAETRNFGYGWGNFSSILILDRLRSIWEYLNQDKTQTLTYIGKFSTYSGGGYVAYLGRNLHNSYVNFFKMVKKMWIDNKTRGFFIEFLTYNVNCNMFNAVRLLFELSASGYTAKTINVFPVRMIFVENELEKISIVFSILFTFWVFILFIQHFIGVLKNFKTFFKSFWYIVDFIIIFLSFVCVIIYLIRIKMIEDYFKNLEKVRHNEFIGYFALFYIEDFLTICAAFLVLISTIRLWKFLRFGLFFRIMERTLETASYQLLSVQFCFLIILTAYSLSGVLIFGNEFPQLSTYMKIVATLVTLALKPDQLDIMTYTKFPVTYFYFSSYLLLMQIIILINITIIIKEFQQAKLDFSVETTYTFRSYLQEQLVYIPKFLRQKYDRMSGGEEKKLVKAKSDKFRYANCVSTQKSKLRIMKCLTKCYVRNNTEKNEFSLTRRDISLMWDIIRLFVFPFEEDQIEIFFVSRFFGKKVLIVDEQRINKIATIVDKLLRDNVDKNRFWKKKTGSDLEKCVKIVQDTQEILKKCCLGLKLSLLKLEFCENFK